MGFAKLSCANQQVASKEPGHVGGLSLSASTCLLSRWQMRQARHQGRSARAMRRYDQAGASEVTVTEGTLCTDEHCW